MKLTVPLVLQLLALGTAVAAGCGEDADGTGGGGTVSTTSSPQGGQGGAAGEAGQGAGGGGGGAAHGGGGSAPASSCDPDVEHGLACLPGSATCEMGSGCCQCRVVSGCGWDPIWVCVEPPGDPGCFSTPPAFNEPCGTDGLVCEYCIAGEARLWRCHGGVWTEQMPSC